MKTVMSIMIALASMAGLGNTPTQIPVALERTFVPIGFDDNDRVQITVQGRFNNTCYKVGPYQFKVDSAKKQLIVEQFAYHYTGLCLQMVVPFVQVMNIGLLRDGKYTIVDKTSNRILGVLPVTHSQDPSPEVYPDDYLYAPITDAVVVNDTATSKSTLRLTGTFTDRCTILRKEKVEVRYYPNVIVVLPIAERTQSRGCDEYTPTRFQIEVELREGLKGSQLLHVRSMSGQAINKIVDLNSDDTDHY